MLLLFHRLCSRILGVQLLQALLTEAIHGAIIVIFFELSNELVLIFVKTTPVNDTSDLFV